MRKARCLEDIAETTQFRALAQGISRSSAWKRDAVLIAAQKFGAPHQAQHAQIVLLADLARGQRGRRKPRGDDDIDHAEPLPRLT